MTEYSDIVSIVTPVFNRADIIHKTVDSVIAQTYQNWELLLVDDGSVDNIAEVIKKKYGNEPRIRFKVRDRDPKGASTCRNVGAEMATGDYLVFLDSDDMLEPHCLEQRIRVMRENPVLDLAVFPFRYVGLDGSLIPNNFDNGREPLINFLSNSSYWAIMCPIWKKVFFRGIGGFNESFPRYQDPELHIRALTQTDVSYRMFMELPPDTVVVPSVKSQSIQFALNTQVSLKLLIPQSYKCLERLNRLSDMRHMEGYLRDWLKFYAHANFVGQLLEECNELLDLYSKYGVISRLKVWLYRKQLSMALFLVKAIRFFYLKLVTVV
jgi:glycosyltransferase involved in cell wall biosynthesis